MTQNCVSFFLLWACWNKFQHGRRPLGWFFKHAIASLWRLGVAVKLAKLGTRTQKNRPKPARDYLFKHTFGVTLFNDCLLKQECMSIHVGIILKHAIVCLLFYTRMYEYPWLFEYCTSLETQSCCQTRQPWHKNTKNSSKHTFGVKLFNDCLFKQESMCGWFLNMPLYLFGDSELLSNSPNLAQEHKKIGPSQQEFKHTFGVKLFNDWLLKQEFMSIHVGIILKHGIVSLWKLGVAVKLAKLGTRTKK